MNGEQFFTAIEMHVLIWGSFFVIDLVFCIEFTFKEK